MSLVNEIMNDYSHFIATALALWEEGAVRIQVADFYTRISTNCRSITLQLREIEQPLANELKKAENKERGIQRRINILKWLGGVVFVGAVAALAFLAYATSVIKTNASLITFYALTALSYQAFDNRGVLPVVPWGKQRF